MIARLLVKVPFVLSIPKDMRFELPDYQIGDCVVRFYSPEARESEQESNVQIQIDGNPTVRADIIHIDFIRDSFDRRKRVPTNPGEIHSDPPIAIIDAVLERFLSRLRHVTRAAVIRSLKLNETDWQIHYLNNDGTELPKEVGMVPWHGATPGSMSWIGLTDAMWNDLHSLPDDYVVPPWEGLLLDASLPGMPIGSSIVLAFTALEVFIAHVLDKLAGSKAMPPELWAWATERPSRLQDPSMEEQFDILLKVLCGHSLKDERALWDTFKRLKSARNNFVHQGVIRIGKTLEPLNAEAGRPLVKGASEIIQQVREWIPAEHHWKEFDHKLKITVCLTLKG